MPTAPGRLPLLGHALPLRRDPLGFLRSLQNAGKLVRIDIGALPVVFVACPDLIQAVTTRQARGFEKGRFHQLMRPMLGNGLGTADARTHRAHRRLIQPMFHNDRITAYCRIIGERARELAQSWTPGQLIAVEKEMRTFAVGTLTATLFPTGVAGNGHRALAEAVGSGPARHHAMLMRAVTPAFLDRLPSSPNRRFHATAKRLHRAVDDLITTARHNPPSDRTDLLSALLASPLTDTEVRDELVTLLFAGTETVASTLAWAFHEIARHPRVEERIVAELDAVLGTPPSPVGSHQLPRLAYTRRVFEETLRLHSITLLMRRATEPVDLGGYALPPGTELAFSPYALHRDARLFPHPDRFDPDRPARALLPPGFIPFGAGNRKCVGDTYAVTESVITLATVLARWHLAPVAGHTPRPSPAGMPHPDHLPMTAHPRRAERP
ncbi:hypothetical protein AC230_20695 [Streptomyces caatingaensis]|uniref:Cytochrome P450 n=2 Tax=Streptomyces caatingaensis TaxID=1678637 RepID=A0A0K9XE21_9ACTN|nr:hypothetical protein AC230_20695 [Streptomyces caatingaensis]